MNRASATGVCIPSPPTADPAAKAAPSGGGCQEEEAQTKADEKEPEASPPSSAKGETKGKGETKAKAEPALDPDQLRREKIKRDNERKLKEHDEKLKKAQGDDKAALEAQIAKGVE